MFDSRIKAAREALAEEENKKKNNNSATNNKAPVAAKWMSLE